MPIQTTFGSSYATKMKGMIPDLVHGVDLTGTTKTDLPFGMGLVLDTPTTDTRLPLKLPSSAADIFAGIAVLTHKMPYGPPVDFSQINSTQTAYYRLGDAVKYRTKGRIVVYSEVPVNPTLPVFLRFTASGLLVPGDFRTDADTAKAMALTKAKWAETTTVAGLAIVYLDY